MKDFEPCPYCQKLNKIDTKRCNWCYSRIPTRLDRAINRVIVVTAMVLLAATIWKFL